MSQSFFFLCETRRKEKKRNLEKTKREIQNEWGTHSYLLQIAMTLLISQLLPD